MTLAVLALSWLMGVAAAAFSGADPAAAVALASMLGAAAFAVRPRVGTLVVVAFAAVLVAGATWRYDETTPSAEGTVAADNGSGEPVRLRGLVDDEPDERPTGRLYRVAVRERFDGVRWVKAEGKVLLRTRSLPAYEHGDLIEMEGELEEAPPLATPPDCGFRTRVALSGALTPSPGSRRRDGRHPPISCPPRAR